MNEAREELDKLVRKEFGLGVKELPGRILRTRDPRLPQFHFEWHPDCQRVYRVDIPGVWIDKQWVESAGVVKGFCIAEHCLTHAQFLGFVQTFCRGYILAVAHQTQGTLNTYVPERIKETDSCPIR